MCPSDQTTDTTASTDTQSTTDASASTSTDSASSTTDPNATSNTDTSNATGAQASDTTSTTSTAPTSTTRTLEQVYEDYEKALADFETKLDLTVAAKTNATSAAQAVVTLKKELDTFEEDVTETFDKVQAYLASA